MTGLAFNVLGSSLSEEVLRFDGKEPITIKGRVVGSNPLFISDGEKESLLSDKAEWVVVDSVYFSKGLNSVEGSANEIDALSKFLKKNWARKVILIRTKPSTRCKDGSMIPSCSRSMSDSVCSMLMERINCYLVSVPSECISKNGNPFCYVDETIGYIRSVIDVIIEKYDRYAVERLSIDYCRDTERLKSEMHEGLKKDRKAYAEAVESKNYVGACAICSDLVSKGDMWAAPYAEPSYSLAAKKCKDTVILTSILRKFSNSGMAWAKYALFDLLWKNASPGSDKEMVSVVLPLAAEGDGSAQMRLGRAYCHGRGVEKDLDRSLELMREARANKTRGSSVELFDVYWAIGTPDAYKRAVSAVKALADNGDVPSMVRMARAYRYGRGVKKDVDKAMGLYDKAAAISPSVSKEREVFKKNLASKK